MINELQSIDIIRKVREERIANNNLFKPLQQVGAKHLNLDEKRKELWNNVWRCADLVTDTKSLKEPSSVV